MIATDFHEALRLSYSTAVPHVRDLGIVLTRVDAEAAEGRLPYKPELLGDAERQLIHTGVITSLIDSICGLALLAHIGQPTRIATLDLRVDYLRASRPGADLVCRADCYRLTEQIAFLRASVWQHDPQQPVAASLGTFMRTGGDPSASGVLR